MPVSRLKSVVSDLAFRLNRFKAIKRLDESACDFFYKLAVTQLKVIFIIFTVGNKTEIMLPTYSITVATTDFTIPPFFTYLGTILFSRFRRTGQQEK